ncbi:hypothetical protein FA95DRAFT_1188447 [Auriscalpium vulgare]|uniref:Uncharacterized protein n=1 Tax=Auriscalpium vulgare TaxID=40419 RepID=A0ACB8R450_9AGAM|nr:hypothetical protein FA95DRAFT_1188447 [Auriscalpium vulgare]
MQLLSNPTDPSLKAKLLSAVSCPSIRSIAGFVRGSQSPPSASQGAKRTNFMAAPLISRFAFTRDLRFRTNHQLREAGGFSCQTSCGPCALPPQLRATADISSRGLLTPSPWSSDGSNRNRCTPEEYVSRILSSSFSTRSACWLASGVLGRHFSGLRVYNRRAALPEALLIASRSPNR